MKTFVVGLVALALCACADKAENNKRFRAKPNSNLANKSTSEVLKTKYNKASFNCKLWVQHGDKLNKELAPNDSFSWNLLEDFAAEKSFSLKGTLPDHTMEVTAKVPSIEIYGSVNHTASDGTVYQMSNTPVVKMDLYFTQTTVYSPGVSSKMTGTDHRKVNENIKDMSFNESHSIDRAKGAIFNYLECSIDTDIKPEFKHEFKVEKKK